MGAFRDAIAKDGKIPHATNRDLQWEQWHQEYESRRSDEIDDEIYKAGRWIYPRLNALRQDISRLVESLGPEFPVLRTLVAATNRHFWSLNKFIGISLERARQASSDMTTSQFRRVGLSKDFLGATHDEVMESAGDCVTSFYRQFSSTSNNFEAVNNVYEALPVVNQIFWAQFHMVRLESVWLACLWHGCRIEERSDESVIRVADSDFERSVVAAADRRESYIGGYIADLTGAWTLRRRRLPVVRAVLRARLEGEHLYFELSKFDDPKHPPWGYLIRHAYTASLPDWLMSVAPPGLGGLTIEDLLSGHEALYSLAHAFLERRVEFADSPHIPILAADAPCISKRSCIELIIKACGFTESKAIRVVDELTLGGKSRDGAWSRPLVPADGHHVYIVYPVLMTSPLRLVDHWLVTGSYPNNKKGADLEQNVRDQLAVALRSNFLSLNAYVYQRSCRLEGKKGPEIDALVRIGRTVLVCEIKCGIQPITSLELNNFLKQVLKGTEQVKKEVAMAKRHRPEIARKVKYAADPKDLHFLPLILVDNGIASGLTLNGVPVLDFHLLRKYLESAEIHFIFSRSAKGPVGLPSENIVVYQNQHDAESNISVYISSPPNERLRHLRIKKVQFRIPDFILGTHRDIVTERFEIPEYTPEEMSDMVALARREWQEKCAARLRAREPRVMR